MKYTTLAVLLFANPTLLAACERAHHHDSMEPDHAPGQPRPVGSGDPTVNVEGTVPGPGGPVVSPTGNRMELAGGGVGGAPDGRAGGANSSGAGGKNPR